MPSPPIPRTVAALYVAPKGCYYGLDGVEPWGLPERDAREYAGPHPVVAHPPCERWGHYWHGGPNSVKYPRTRRIKGDDGGCFAAALSAVRAWGGVLEHPEASAAWRTFGLIPPVRDGAWLAAGDFRGWTCCVEQGWYGHRARKATWLYVCGVTRLPSLVWGKSPATVRLDDGYGSAAARAADKARRETTSRKQRERLSHSERSATPIPFRDLLLGIARSARAA